MKIVESRIDHLTMRYRVTLAPAFVEELRLRADVAREHGRASFSWGVGKGVPFLKNATNPRRIAPSADGTASFLDHRRRRAIWGELRFSRAAKVWNITNEPIFRMKIDAHAPGAEERLDDATGEHVKEGGWTVEVIFYAQHLAEIGLDAALTEGLNLASLCGEVHAQRVGRVDLAADIAGWAIEEDDVAKLAKRPRAKWTREFGDGSDKDEPSAQDFGKGALDKRTMTGLSVGRGGALMCRIYDKRAELTSSSDERTKLRKATEEARWTLGGWDGDEPVTRVEFQIRGVALQELGIRDPEIAYEVETNKEGKITGQRIAMGEGEDGRRRVLGIVDRLNAVWLTCIVWVRLVVLERTETGRLKPVARLPLDPRWALLHEVRFNARRGSPIKRFRSRVAASWAQGLGVAISQAGQAGELVALSESLTSYNEVDGHDVLRARLDKLKADEASRIFEALLNKCGDPMRANVHLAVRVNAARLRFAEKENDAAFSTGPPDEHGPGPRTATRRRGAEQSRSGETIGAVA